MTTCIRRRNALWTTCPCKPCRTASRRLQKLYTAGRLNRPDPEATVARILDWNAAGYSIAWIASASNTSPAWVLTVVEHRTTNPGPILCDKILRADINNATRGLGPALGARRRLQALAVIGWDLDTLTARTGIPRTVLSRIRSGQAPTIHAARHHQITAAYDALSGARGPSVQGITRASKKGWAPPAAWDNPDDPAETYEPTVKRAAGGSGRSVADLVEELEHLLWFDPSLTAQQLADRLGYKDRSAVQNALARHGHRDLLDRLNRNSDRSAA